MKNTNLDKRVVVDHEKCVQCGRCADICWNGAMKMGPDGYPYMSITELTDERSGLHLRVHSLGGAPDLPPDAGVPADSGEPLHQLPGGVRLAGVPVRPGRPAQRRAENQPHHQ